MRYTHIIIHCDEITLKGGNRPFFERALLANIKEFLSEVKYNGISKDGGKIVVDINKNELNVFSSQSKARLRLGGNFGAELAETEKIKEILKNIPGISNFYFAVEEEKDMDKINKKTVEAIKLHIEKNKAILRQAQDDKLKFLSDKIETFKIEARRSDKKFEFKSPEINAKVGEYVLNNTKLKVDVHNPDLEIVIDIGNKKCFIYFEKIKGVGGLPVGTTGNLASLISGGIDSPVASFMMNKRGAKNIFVHFKNKTISGSADGQDKIESLVKELTKFQGRSKLYIVPFEEFQKEIIAKIPSKNRMIIYRRMMFKLAGMIAKKENAKGFVTGDSLSQVASQTIDNITAIYNAANLPIFPPLIGMNKQEIIDIASRIGTYKISILPYQDCCSFLIAKHPETKAKLEEIISQEKNLEIEKIAEEISREIKPKIIEM